MCVIWVFALSVLTVLLYNFLSVFLSVLASLFSPYIFVFCGWGENLTIMNNMYCLPGQTNTSNCVCCFICVLQCLISVPLSHFSLYVWLFQCKGLPKRLVRASILKHRRSASLGLLKMVRSSRHLTWGTVHGSRYTFHLGWGPHVCFVWCLTASLVSFVS